MRTFRAGVPGAVDVLLGLGLVLSVLAAVCLPRYLAPPCTPFNDSGPCGCAPQNPPCAQPCRGCCPGGCQPLPPPPTAGGK